MNITITGNLGSGKSSVAKILKEQGYEYSSTGNIFRQLAMEQGLSVEEFNKQVNEAASREIGRASCRERVFRAV